MTLSSLFRNDGPLLTIVNSRLSIESTTTFDWSDFPLFLSDEALMTIHQTKPNDEILVKPIHRSATSVGDFELSPDFSSPSMASNSSPSFDPCTSQPLPTSPVVSLSSFGQTHKSPSRNHHKIVSFSRFLEIREHSVTVGDHPCCDTLPLTLDWKHAPSNQIPFDDFESERALQRRPSRQLRLSYFERRDILRRIAGLTETDLMQSYASSLVEVSSLRHVATSYFLQG